jgi:hypothetical protein
MIPLSEKTFGNRYNWLLTFILSGTRPGGLKSSCTEQVRNRLSCKTRMKFCKVTLKLQILLDLTEEDLDLPALLADIGDGLGYQPGVVGEEHRNPVGFGVLGFWFLRQKFP